MQNFVILVNWGDIAPAEYVYKSESYESLIKSYEFVKEMSKYKPDTEFKCYQLTDEKVKLYIEDAKIRAKELNAYRKEIETKRANLEKKGFLNIIVDGSTMYGFK